MRTPKEKAENLLAHIQKVADARIRPMMGEYILYVDDKVIGQINHSLLFIKATPFGEVFAPELEKEPPYDGANLLLLCRRTRSTTKYGYGSFLRELLKSCRKANLIMLTVNAKMIKDIT